MLLVAAGAIALFAVSLVAAFVLTRGSGARDVGHTMPNGRMMTAPMHTMDDGHVMTGETMP